MRNLVMLGCAGLLAWALALTTFAQVPSELDVDGDGVLDPNDNCLTDPNGPLASTFACDDQEDGDRDGYGNACDWDYNNNGAPDLLDLYDVLIAAANVSTDLKFDNNCNGSADLVDVLGCYGEAASLHLHPSGLACAGTIPCP